VKAFSLAESDAYQEALQTSSSSVEGQSLGGVFVAVKMASNANLADSAVMQGLHEPLSLFRFCWSFQSAAVPEFQIKFCVTSAFALGVYAPGAIAIEDEIKEIKKKKVTAGQGSPVAAQVGAIGAGLFSNNGRQEGTELYMYSHHEYATVVRSYPSHQGGSWIYTCGRASCGNHKVVAKTYNFGPHDKTGRWKVVQDSDGTHYLNGYGSGYLAFCGGKAGCHGSLYGVVTYLNKSLASTAFTTLPVTGSITQIHLKQPGHSTYVGVCGGEPNGCGGFGVYAFPTSGPYQPGTTKMTLQEALTVPYGGVYIQDSESWLLYNPGNQVFAIWCGGAGHCSATHGVYGYSRAVTKSKSAAALNASFGTYLYGTSTNPNQVWIKQPSHATWLGASCSDLHCAAHAVHAGGASKYGVYAFVAESDAGNSHQLVIRNQEYVYIKNQDAAHSTAPYIGTGCAASTGRSGACGSTHGMHLFPTRGQRTIWIMVKVTSTTLPWNYYSDDNIRFLNPHHSSSYLIMCGHDVRGCFANTYGIYTKLAVDAHCWWTLKVTGISFQMVQSAHTGTHPMTLGSFLGFCGKQVSKNCGVADNRSSSDIVGYKNVQGTNNGRWVWETAAVKYTDSGYLKNGYRNAVGDKYMAVCGGAEGCSCSYAVQGYKAVTTTHGVFEWHSSHV